VQDALGLVPLGYSSAAFCLAAWAVQRQRARVFPRSFGARAVFGAAAAAGVALVQALLLAAGERRWPGAGLVARRALGALLLGAALTPWVCAWADRLDAALGLTAPEARA
jgi:rod shape-determining protein MreD